MIIYTIESSERETSGNSSVDGTSNNFYLNIAEKHDSRWSGVTKVRLLGFTAPHTLYNIRSGVNNKMVWRRTATNYTYTIPPGQYDAATLALTIQAGMEAADANTWVVTFSEVTQKFTIAGAGAFELTFLSHPNAATSCFKELGWTAADVASATSQTAPNVCSLHGPTRLYIDMNVLPPKTVTAQSKDRHSFVIPIDTSPGYIIEYNVAQYFEQVFAFDHPISASELYIKLFLPNNEPADLNGAEWTMLLELWK